MKTNQTDRSAVIRSIRNPQASPEVSSFQEAAPFQEGDVVEYIADPRHRFIVAHCYVRHVGDQRQWIVAEVNANTHAADELRRVGLG